MSEEALGAVSESDQLLELVALELAYVRMKIVNEADTSQTLKSVEEMIDQKQRTLNILPIQITAKRLGINVSFLYTNWGGERITPSSLEIKNELEGRVWQDPLLQAKLLEAKASSNKIVRALRELSLCHVGSTQSAGSYTEPKYSIPF